MPIKSKTALKSAFQTGDIPTQADFEDLIDSFKDNVAITKEDVGLGNVIDVPQIPASQKGANNGVAELDANGKVLSSQLPAYVDDVLEFANLAAFPATGTSGIIYVAVNTNLSYRWSGSAYVALSSSVALGETSSTAYRGDRGKIAYDHSQVAHVQPAELDALKIKRVSGEVQSGLLDFDGKDYSTIDLTGDLTITGISGLDTGVGNKIFKLNGFNLLISTALIPASRQAPLTVWDNDTVFIRFINTGTLATPFYFSGDGNGSAITAPPAGDTTPPNESNISVSGQTQTSLIFNIQSDEAATIYAIAKSNVADNDPLNISEIINGVGAIAQTTPKTTLGSSVESLGFSGLTNGTTFKIYACIIDAAGNNKGVLGPYTGTTVAVDTTPPVLTLAQVINNTSQGGTLSIRSNEAATLHLSVYANNATAPTPTAVKNGTGDVASANTTTQGGITELIPFSGLDPNTAYDLYFVAEDNAGNLSTTVTKIDFSTLATGVPDSLTIKYKATSGQTALTKYDYLLYLPENYNPAVAYPLILHLHGLGEKGSDPTMLDNNGLGKALALDQCNPQAICVLPQSWSGYWSDTDNQPVLKQFIDYVLDESKFGHKINHSKCGISGLSLGGGGTVETMKDPVYRAKFAWMAPMSGHINGQTSASGWDDIAYWGFHGATDANSATPVSNTYLTYYGCLQQSNPVTPPRMTIYTSGTHSDNVWAETWSGANHDDAVSNYSYNAVPLNSTQHTAANDFLTWALSQTKAGGDTTPPTQLTPTTTAVTNNTADGRFQSNENGSVFAAVYPSATTLRSRSEIEQGTGAVAYIQGGSAVVANVLKTWQFTGLTAGTGYKVHSFVLDVSGNQSNILMSATFTTLAADTTAPTLSLVSIDNPGLTTMDGHARINEAGTIYVAWTLAAAAALTHAQIVAGTGNGIVFAANKATVGNVTENFAATGLANGTNYKMQVTAIDSASNAIVTPTVTSNLSTTAPATSTRILISLGDSGSSDLSGEAVAWNVWNANVGSGGNGTSIPLDYEDGTPSGASLIKVLGYVTPGTGLGTTGGIYPNAATIDYWFNADTTGWKMKFAGLKASQTYDLDCFPARATVAGTRRTNFTMVGGTVQGGSTEGGKSIVANPIEAISNSNKVVRIRFTTNASGESGDLSIVKYSADQYAYLNVMELNEV